MGASPLAPRARDRLVDVNRPADEREYGGGVEDEADRPGGLHRLRQQNRHLPAGQDQPILDTVHATRPGRRRGHLATALNLLRLHAFWTGTPLDRQRTSHLARLELSLAT